MKQLSTLFSSLLGAALLAAAPAAFAQPVPAVDAIPDEVLFEFDTPALQLPPAVIRSGLPPRTAGLLGEAFEAAEGLIDRRVELMRELGRSSLPEAVPFIRTALGDANDRVRATAAWAAARSRQTQLAEDLLSRLSDPSPQVRAAVVAAHAQLTANRDQPSPAIIAGLKDQNPSVRRAAIAHVALAAEADALRGILPSLAGSAQLEAIATLAGFADGPNIDVVASLLDSDDIGIRSAVIAALGRMKATAHAQRIEALLKHDHPTIRRAAVAALPGVSGEERARELGEPMLEDRDLSVQTAAAGVVGPVRSVAIADALVERLASPYLPLHDAALATLTQPANDAVRQSIIDHAATLLDIPNARRRQDGALLLGTFRSGAATDKLLTLLNSRGGDNDAFDGAAMQEVARALGLIGDQRAAEVFASVATRGTNYTLAAATASGNPADALAGAALPEALVGWARLGDAGVVKQAVRVLQSNPDFIPPDARQAAAWAIGHAGTPGDNGLRGPLLQALSAADSEESTFEAVKAIGRLRLDNTQTELRTAAEQTSHPRVRWMALWAIARLTGETEPYVTPVATETPNLIIQDLAGR